MTTRTGSRSNRTRTGATSRTGSRSSSRAGTRDKIRVGDRRVALSRPDKELFPGDGIAKAELVDYYRTVARPMLTHLKDRPLVMERYPDGYEGKSFFHKDVSGYFPEWIRTVRVPKEGGSLTMAVCDDKATLVYLANQACITPHPWLSLADRLDCPDRLVFDLDPPGEGESEDGFETVRWSARALGDLLTELGLRPALMTTGSRGLHLVVLLDRHTDFDTARQFARRVADVLAGRHSDRLTTEPRKNKRRGRLYLDTQRNAYAQTSVAPYAVRARPHAPVATPLDWAELDDRDLTPRRWTLRTLPGRLDKDGDPWKGLSDCRRSLSGARRRLDDLVRDDAVT
ncbi:non-homologous end-joining DNA ligase [Streptomyces beihaiensis]|uniref:Non-homologous end-joining DNA ligase n=1 Tax=Streptomyces beihaiensis TaxID=2984495 RepID=A0ABT3TRB1_9ACTN|nr:non-homologous end-joining DNA ligase [Streptomyces beihaiensis]MCX3058573.1 non-homologous end-joining DNA ligase [Streptomyces beihaiensis]